MSRTFIRDNRKRSFLVALFVVLIVTVTAAFAYARVSSGAAPGAGLAVEPDGASVLLSLADSAYRERRIVAPAGSNMYEFYLSLLELEPTNALARERMRAEFATASHEVELVISAGDLDEAERQLRLLHDYGKRQLVESDSYKLALLGSYLHAQRNLLSRAHETEALQLHDARTGPAAP